MSVILLILSVCFLAQTGAAQIIGNHPAVYDQRGILQPWMPWRDALQREVNWYLKCPWTNGYPRFVVMTFMDGHYDPNQNRPDCIPAMQNGMGIISYLKYHEWSGRKEPKVLEIARSMGDFLVKENLTPDNGKYPRFPRSTGRRFQFPQPPDPDWKRDARTLINFVNNRFTSIKSGVLVCGEQDDDINPWGGAVSTYGAVLAVYSRATGSSEFKGTAWQVLNYALYSIDNDGCPSEAVWKGKRRGGWQEDAHTDKLHNFVDAMTAFPE